MKHWMSLAFVLAFISSAWATDRTDQIIEEVIYNEYKSHIQSHETQNLHSLNGFTPFEQSLFVDALWDALDDGNQNAISFLDNVMTYHYELVEKLRVAILRIKYQRATVLPKDLVNELRAVLKTKNVETKLIYTLAAYESDLLSAGHKDIIKLAKKHPQYFDVAEDEVRGKEITDDLIEDLFHKSPDTTTYMNGEYVKSVKIFMFCRENRLFPCLMVMRNIHGEVVRNADGAIWTNPSLASSSKGLPSYTRNGNTPAGIFTIDSVMPAADQQMSFGKYRRMMLNFVPKSKDEVLFKSLLPESSRNLDWWTTSIVARDAGRNLFRIHGTGKTNADPSTPYFPFMRTSGCIAQRENTYGTVTFKDQRELLDDIMKAMDMTPNYANEVNVKGILYIVEIDDQTGPVTASDLALRGIE